MRKTPFFGALILILGFVVPSVAEEESFSANVTLASDYSFRGWSQTTRDPAIQGGFDYDFGNGFSVGTWASNINFGDSASLEWDLYFGFGGSVGEEASWSASLIRFEYPSEGEALDYMEFVFGFEIKNVSLGVAYSPSYLGDGGPTFFYPNIAYSVDLSDLATLDLALGFSSVDANSFFDDGVDNYLDYSAAITMPFAGIDLSLGLVGTNLDAGVDTETRLIISLSKSI